MVLNTKNIFLKKKNIFLNFFFHLGVKKCWSGGRSRGLKVFGGQVGGVSKRGFNYGIIGNYGIINIQGFNQSYFKPFNKNFLLTLVFFQKYGMLAFLPSSESSVLKKTYITTLIEKSNNISDATILKYLEIGTTIYSLQTKKKLSATVAGSSGTFCKILKKFSSRIFIQYPSTVISIIPDECFATKGANKKLLGVKLKKAGDSKKLGKIPKVGGIAMNPVDHPHGGGTNGGRHPCTPTGLLTKNVKTGKGKKWSNSNIFSLRT